MMVVVSVIVVSMMVVVLVVTVITTAQIEQTIPVDRKLIANQTAAQGGERVPKTGPGGALVRSVG